MLSITLPSLAKGCSAFPTGIKVGIKQMQGSPFYFSSILGNMGKTKADFELSPRSVKTCYFKVRMNQPKRSFLAFLKLFSQAHSQILDPEKKGL